MQTTALTEEQRIELVANRISAYYHQIIVYKKAKGIKTFVLDKVPQSNEANVSLVHLEDKYDGKSSWRKALEIPDADNAWHTISSNEVKPFAEMGKNDQGQFYINIESVLQKVSLLLSKQGVANYFGQPDCELNYFWKGDKAWFTIVL